LNHINIELVGTVALIDTNTTMARDPVTDPGEIELPKRGFSKQCAFYLTLCVQKREIDVASLRNVDV
jgi:hypothetical protein